MSAIGSVICSPVFLHVRGLLERHAAANEENIWNGRPISTIGLVLPMEESWTDRSTPRWAEIRELASGSPGDPASPG